LACPHAVEAIPELVQYNNAMVEQVLNIKSFLKWSFPTFIRKILFKGENTDKTIWEKLFKNAKFNYFTINGSDHYSMFTKTNIMKISEKMFQVL